MSSGHLALVLHAHLPFVRHPEHARSQEESWLFEGITESYVPLLGMMERVRADASPFKLTLSVSPTLGTMLTDPLLLQRCTPRRMVATSPVQRRSRSCATVAVKAP